MMAEHYIIFSLLPVDLLLMSHKSQKLGAYEDYFRRETFCIPFAKAGSFLR